MISAPAASTLVTSSPSRAKSAERMEGAMMYFVFPQTMSSFFGLKMIYIPFYLLGVCFIFSIFGVFCLVDSCFVFLVEDIHLPTLQG